MYIHLCVYAYAYLHTHMLMYKIYTQKKTTVNIHIRFGKEINNKLKYGCIIKFLRNLRRCIY